jgi:hypothetical protein
MRPTRATAGRSRRSFRPPGTSARRSSSSSTPTASTARGTSPRLLAELRQGNDVVIGSRFVEGSAGDIPAYRKVGMKVLDTATTLAGNNLAITDSQSGFRAYGRKAIEAIHISGEGMSAGSEILIQISDHRLKVAEVPIRVRYDIEGTSSENPVSHGVGVLMNIVKLISFRRPLVFFGIPGTLFALLGIGAEIYTFSEYYRTAQFHYIVFTGGFSMLILGLLLATVGIILYSLVQIMQGQRSGEKTNSAAAAGSPVGQGTGKAEQGSSH